MDPPEMRLQVSPARRRRSSASSGGLPSGVEISLEAQSQDRREKAAISIRVSDPDVMVDRILSVLAAKFPINAFYKVIANQEKYVREAVSAGVSPGSVDRRVQEAMYLDLLQLSERSPDANSVTNRSATALIKDALATLTAEELVEVTTSVSPSNSSKLAKVLLNRVRAQDDNQAAPKPTTCLTGEEVIAAAVETEPSELSSGKWESVNESLLLADRETEHSNGAESLSSHFSSPSQVSDWKELAYRTWDSAIVDQAMNMSASELARVVEGDSLVNVAVSELAQSNSRFREWIEELLTVKRKSARTVVRTSVQLESQPAVEGIRIVRGAQTTTTTTTTTSELGGLRPAPIAFEGVGSSQTVESSRLTSQQTMSTYSQVVMEDTQVPLGVPLSEMAPGLVNTVEETPSAIQAPDVTNFERRTSSHSHSSQRKMSDRPPSEHNVPVQNPPMVERRISIEQRGGESQVSAAINAPMVVEARGELTSVRQEGITMTTTTATSTTTTATTAGSQVIPPLVMTESPMRMSSWQTFEFSDVSSNMCRITDVHREGSPAQEMASRMAAQPMQLVEGDVRLAWLTKIEVALEQEYRHIVGIARERVSRLLQELRVPGRNLSAFTNEQGIQFVRQNQALAKRVVLGLKYAVFSTIKSVCEQAGFAVNLPDVPEAPLVPVEELDQHGPIGQLLVEAAVRVAIFGCATYLTNVTSVRECTPELQAVMRVPTDVAQLQRAQWLVDHVSSRRREMLSNALNASIDSYQWEVLNGRGMLAFVESFFTRRAYAAAPEMIREVSDEIDNVVAPPSVVRRNYEAQQAALDPSPSTPESGVHHMPKAAQQAAVAAYEAAQQQQQSHVQQQTGVQSSVQSSAQTSFQTSVQTSVQAAVHQSPPVTQSRIVSQPQSEAYSPALPMQVNKSFPARSASSLAAYNVVSSRVISHSSSALPTSPAVRTIVPPRSPTTTYTKTYTTAPGPAPGIATTTTYSR